MAEVTDVDAEQRQVVLDRGEPLDYDSLIVACGAETSYFGHDEWQDVTFGLKTLADAVDLRERFSRRLRGGRAHRRPGRAGRVAHLRGRRRRADRGRGRGPARDHRRSDEARLLRASTRRRAVILLDAGDRVVPAFSEKLSAKAASELAELGVTVREGARATAIDDGG